MKERQKLNNSKNANFINTQTNTKDAGVPKKYESLPTYKSCPSIKKAPYTINTNFLTWDAQFKKAIKSNDKPEGDLWESVQNSFDREEWI